MRCDRQPGEDHDALTPLASRRTRRACAAERRLGAGKGRALWDSDDRHSADHRPARSCANAYQYTGLTLYDPLIAWELDVSDRPGKMIPGLATEWKVGEADKTLWTFKLRPGVNFHDGSAFDADAVIWSLEKVFNKEAPQFDTRQSGAGTAAPAGALELSQERRHGDRDQDQVGRLALPLSAPVVPGVEPGAVGEGRQGLEQVRPGALGHRAVQADALVPRERAELVRNDAYWNAKRVPKVDRIVFVCAPEDSGRSAALLSGNFDMIDGPAPDMIDRLKQSSIRISTNITPHVFQYHPSLVEGSPWTDVRVRKAANLAIDRDAIVKLLNGLVTPAYGEVDREQPVVRQAHLRAEVRARRGAQADGGGGLLQGQADEGACLDPGQRHQPDGQRGHPGDAEGVLFDIEFKPVELEALMTGWRGSAKADMNKDVSATNVTHVTSDPFYAANRFFASDQIAPIGVELELLQEPRSRPARGRAQDHLRSGQAGRDHGQDPRQGRRRCRDDLGLSRHHGTGAVAPDQEVRAGPELVPGPGAGRLASMSTLLVSTTWSGDIGPESKTLGVID